MNKNIDNSDIKSYNVEVDNLAIESSNITQSYSNENVLINEEEQDTKRERLLLLKQKIISRTQKDNEEEKKSTFKGNNSRSQSIEKIMNKISIQLNINSESESEDKGKNISKEISSNDNDKFIKKRSIKALENLEKEVEEPDVTKKIKLS